MKTLPVKELVLGAEFDVMLRRVLIETLSTLSGQSVEHWQGVGGSQELENFTFSIQGREVELQFETYVGASIRGPAELVDHIATLVREKHQNTK